MKKYERDLYAHKFTMKPEAFQVMMKQRSGSPRLITRTEEFNQAVREYILKDINKDEDKMDSSRIQRKTRMGGHLSSTLGKAGLANLGLVTYSPKAK